MDSFFLSGLHVLGQSNRDGAQVNPSAIKGELGTGFEKRSDKGLFECGNCEHFDASDGACDQWDMKMKSKQPKLDDGRISVAFDDCCEYIERIGKSNDSND
jgi:hypothetical protein